MVNGSILSAAEKPINFVILPTLDRLSYRDPLFISAGASIEQKYAATSNAT
jgi:hypothetical protein